MDCAGQSLETPERHIGRSRARVLMLGTSSETKGGISSVIKIYESGGLFSRWPITYLATHLDCGPLRKLLIAMSAWLSYAGWLVRCRDFVLHAHTASRASFWRKTTFILPAIWLKRPVIFHLHGGEFMQFFGEESGPVARRIIRYVLDNCTEIVVLSESWRSAIAGITRNSSIEVIANPVLPYQAPPTPMARVPGTLLFLGRVGRHKGIYVLFDALVKLREQGVDVRLVCGGDGDLVEIRSLVSRLGLGDRVEILGWVDEARRAELLAAASIYVLPSYGEGLPMSILEAMSAGLPVIATPVGGIPSAITNGEEGILVPVGDATALGDAICNLINDADYRRVLGVRAKAKFDDSFSAAVVLPCLDSLYRKMGVTPIKME